MKISKHIKPPIRIDGLLSTLVGLNETSRRSHSIAEIEGLQSTMAPSQKNDAAWESHRSELKSLYQRLTVDEIREYMSELNNFSKR